MKTNLTETLLPVAPPTAVTGLSLLGIGLDQWVLLLNAVYITLGIVYLLYRMTQKEKPNDSQ
jgi:hypothetical protein